MTAAGIGPGYSGSDMAHLCREAAMGPIRTITDISRITAADVRPIQLVDFEYALTQVSKEKTRRGRALGPKDSALKKKTGMRRVLAVHRCARACPPRTWTRTLSGIASSAASGSRLALTQPRCARQECPRSAL